MEWSKRLSIFKWKQVNSKMNILSFLIYKYFHIFHYFRIVAHATTHTEDSVYIIGGHPYLLDSDGLISTIAKYEDDIWTIVGNLKQARGAHGAITLKGKTLIIGGWPHSSRTT